jgi:hypothetical protein
MSKQAHPCFRDDECQYNVFGYLAIFSSLLAGFFLFAVEQFIFWPYIFEEIVKALIVYFFIFKISANCPCKKIFFTIGSWFVFILMENIFYLPQFISQNDLSLFYQRFLGPSILHFITFALLLIFPWKYKHLIWLVLLANIFLHYLFNLGVIKFF